MSGSKLAIFSVSNTHALEEALRCETYGFDLLILATIEGDYIGDYSLEGRFILFFDTSYSPGIISKLAFSFAVERRYETVSGIFRWGAISLEELAKIKAPLGLHLIPVVKIDQSWIQKIIGSIANLPREFLESFNLKGVFSGQMLRDLPIDRNLTKDSFDTELLFQIRSGNYPIIIDSYRTLPGDTGLTPTSIQLVKLALTQRLQRLGLFYDPRFDLITENNQYEPKFDFLSSHSLTLNKITSKDRLLILGSGPKALVEPFSKRASSVVAVDSFIAKDLKELCPESTEADLELIKNYDSIAPNSNFSKVIALDIIEHLRSPEEFLRNIRSSSCTAGTQVILTTPNIAFLPIRLMLLFGFFNYGKRGILDRTHTRLFTITSLRRLLKQSGFEIEEIRGIPAPIPLAVGRGILGELLLQLNDLLIRILPSLFSFQILAVGRALPTVDQLLLETRPPALKKVQ